MLLRKFFKLSPHAISSLLAALTFAGCGREEIKVYRAAKDVPPQPQSQSMPDGHPEINRPQPKLSWTLPEGWKVVSSGQLSMARFMITAADGKEAEVAITPLRGLSGKETVIVNLWRQTAGQSELSAEEAQKQLQPVDVGGEAGKMFEVSSKAEGTNAPMKIVTAMVHHPDTSWFYKLAGNAEVVEAQKATFVTFLKSVKISEAPAETATDSKPAEPGTATETPATSSGWKIPTDWKTVSPGPMQNAKFSVPEKNGGKAEVTVSIFPNDTGGTLGNVNRWRRQLGLAEVTEAELSKLISALDEKIPKSVLVDMEGKDAKTGQAARMVGAIVPRDGQWYFYKLMGHPDAVAPQKDAFVAFAKSPPGNS